MKPELDLEILGHNAWEKGATKEAFKIFKECAALGIVGCMFDLGYLYDNGIGIRKNKKEAIFWYKRAYRKGYSGAAYNIAFYYNEINRPKLAVQWFKRAVALGDGDAYLDLAKHYINGLGVRSSPKLAKQYLKKAIKSKHITEYSREQALIMQTEISKCL